MKLLIADINEDQTTHIRKQMARIESEIVDVDMEIEDAESRRGALEREWQDLKDELAELEGIEMGQVPDEGPQRFGCLDCSWWAESWDADSVRWRAEEHAAREGHRVAWVVAGGSALFEQDRIELAVSA